MNTKKTNTLPWSVLINLITVYICYEICRFAFLFENWSLFQDNLSWKSLGKMLLGGLVFDSSAICYTNVLYILLVLFPLHYKETNLFRKIVKWLFILTNSICIIANLMDAVYFSFTQHRATTIIFEEFKHETNLGTIFGIEFIRHWYLVVLAAVLIFALIKLYKDTQTTKYIDLPKYYIKQLVLLLVAAPLIVSGMRGLSLATAIRPVSISDAHQYVEHPQETGIVLNTPFAIFRTLKKSNLNIPTYFQNRAELDSLYSPVHNPDKQSIPRKKNIVILIVENFASEFIGALNKDLDNGQYRGYTPFTDSLLHHCSTYQETFCNTWTSIDAMPAILSSIPKMGTPFVLSPFSLNTINSIASELKKWGYYTAFFHGAENRSMGFQAFACSAGFTDYFGRTEFNQHPQFGGDKEFDGTWAIWDEPFLQYFCYELNQMKEPFLASVFTATSHHPFAIPDKYKDVFKDEGIHLIHKCIRYTDYSIRQFFATASKQDWYPNTLFVITADHASSKITHDEYKTELGHFRVPILIFDPSGEIPAGCHEGIAQQIDIMPTLLNYLGYDKPYIAFGKDLFNTKPADTWAINWGQIPQFIKGDYLMQLNENEVSGIYAYRTDRLLKHNLKGKIAEEADMERQMKAIMQSYMERMKADSICLNKY